MGKHLRGTRSKSLCTSWSWESPSIAKSLWTAERNEKNISHILCCFLSPVLAQVAAKVEQEAGSNVLVNSCCPGEGLICFSVSLSVVGESLLCVGEDIRSFFMLAPRFRGDARTTAAHHSALALCGASRSVGGKNLSYLIASPSISTG